MSNPVKKKHSIRIFDSIAAIIIGLTVSQIVTFPIQSGDIAPHVIVLIPIVIYMIIRIAMPSSTKRDAINVSCFTFIYMLFFITFALFANDNDSGATGNIAGAVVLSFAFMCIAGLFFLIANNIAIKNIKKVYSFAKNDRKLTSQ